MKSTFSTRFAGGETVGGRLATSIRMMIASLRHRLGRGFGGGYRPERHYMRGPGPKSSARNSRIAE